MEVFEMIAREMNRKNWSKMKLAKILNNHPSTVTGLLSKQAVKVSRLIQLSEVFQYNFFREIAASLPYNEPDYEIKLDEEAINAPLMEQIKKQEMEIANLKLEINILRQTLKDAVTAK